jgi:ArsR family transcriptional regulator
LPTPDIFKALAEPIRHRLLQVLIAQELNVSELVDVLDQPQSTISRHLKVLRDVELLVDRRCGPTTFYAARPINPAGPEGDGHGSIGDRLLEWVAREPLDMALQQRLEAVIARRRGGSTFFDAIGARWDQLRIDAFGDAFHLEALTALLPREWTVADIGTGTGYLLPVLALRFRRVIAIDPAESMLQLARGRADVRTRENVEFRAGLLEQLPINDGELDLAIASLVLHHVPDPQAGLREIARAVRPKGRLLLIEQHAHEHQSFHDRMGDVWWGFEPGQLRRWTQAAGFQQVLVHEVTSAHPSGRNLGEVPRLFALTAERLPS